MGPITVTPSSVVPKMAGLSSAKATTSHVRWSSLIAFTAWAVSRANPPAPITTRGCTSDRHAARTGRCELDDTCHAIKVVVGHRVMQGKDQRIAGEEVGHG